MSFFENILNTYISGHLAVLILLIRLIAIILNFSQRCLIKYNCNGVLKIAKFNFMHRKYLLIGIFIQLCTKIPYLHPAYFYSGKFLLVGGDATIEVALVYPCIKDYE